MIAVRLRTVSTVTEHTVGTDDHGKPVVEQHETLAPEGVDARRAIATEAPKGDTVQTYYVEDDAVPEGATVLRPDDLPQRTDLPKDHPLFGARVLSVVPAGWPDATLDDKGRLVPVDGKGEPVKPGPGPGEAEAVEVNRAP